MVISNKNKTFFLYLRCNPRYESDGGSEDEERPKETTSMKRPKKNSSKDLSTERGTKTKDPSSTSTSSFAHINVWRWK